MATAKRARSAAASAHSEPRSWQVRVDWPTRFRLYSGLVLFSFALSHFLNHTLGLISIEAMENGRIAFLLLWRSLPGTVALYGSFAVHFGFSMWKIYRRRGFRMHWWEAMQLVLGLSIPLLLIPHVLGTRIMNTAFGVDDLYMYVLLNLWPDHIWTQSVLMLVVWVHGCIGVHYWMRLKRWYRRLSPLWLVIAALIPIGALGGFAVRGPQVEELARNGAYLRLLVERVNWPSPQAELVVNAMETRLVVAFVAALLMVLAARALRAFVDLRRGTVKIRYPGGKMVEIKRGHSVLEASRFAGVPHAAICGGRGRCSTCRVRVGRGLASLPPPNDDELDTLERVGAGPSERLACQIRPLSEIEVTPLLPETAGPEDADGRPAYIKGARQDVTLLMADLRGARTLTDAAENEELVFLLNQYYRAMAGCIEQLGGRVERFDGGRITALFGVGGDPRTAAAAAIGAACLMDDALAHFCSTYATDLRNGGLREPLRVAIGIHSGSAVVGEIGAYAQPVLTAIGTVALTATRLQDAAVLLDCAALVSTDAALRARIDLSSFPGKLIQVRRGEAPVTAFAVASTRKLGEVMLKQAAAAIATARQQAVEAREAQQQAAGE